MKCNLCLEFYLWKHIFLNSPYFQTMMYKKTFDLQTLKEKFSLPESWTNSIIFILNVLIAIPVFLIAHQNLVTVNWPGHLDRIILFLLIIVLIQLILRLVKTIIVLVIICYFIALFIGNNIIF